MGKGLAPYNLDFPLISLPSLPRFLQNVRFSFLLIITPLVTANENRWPSGELTLSPANSQQGYQVTFINHACVSLK